MERPSGRRPQDGMADPGTGTPAEFRGPHSWVEGSKIGVLTDNPESYSAIFVNSVNSDTTPAGRRMDPAQTRAIGPPDCYRNGEQAGQHIANPRRESELARHEIARPTAPTQASPRPFRRTVPAMSLSRSDERAPTNRAAPRPATRCHRAWSIRNPHAAAWWETQSASPGRLAPIHAA